ncbi:MAG: histidine phosphatase family protein [Armatimonadota bacterium]
MAQTDNPDAAENTAASSPSADADDELTVLLVRHGETTSNAEGRIQGHLDVPLSDRGRLQAQSLVSRLSHVWSGNGDGAFPVSLPCAIFSSDLSRAAETARILHTGVPALASLPFAETALLRERGFGEWEGLTSVEIRSRYSNGAPLWTAPLNPPGSETWAAVGQRMEKALHHVREHLPPVAPDAQMPLTRSVVLVGHGGSLRMLLAFALGLGPEAAYAFRLNNTSLSAATFLGLGSSKSKGRIILVNDTAHLETDIAV